MKKAVNSLLAVAALFMVSGLVSQTEALAGGCGGKTVTCKTTGNAIFGMVPEGQAWADESNFLCGGNTTFTAQVKNVNVPDGTVLTMTLDFGLVGYVTVTNHQATLPATSLGHFALSHDQWAVLEGNTEIMECNNFF